jgi:hypothetical protein
MRRTRVMMVLAGAVAASCAASLAVMAAPAFGAAARAGGWGKAIEVPGLARLSAGQGGTLVAVSCSSPGDCAATGNYADRLGGSQAFVVGEKNGSWSTAIEVPRLAALNTGGDAAVMSLSCRSAGNCAVGGSYSRSSGGSRAFVASEKYGSWGRAMPVPGVAALTGAKGNSWVDAVSCGSAGNCAAGGNYSSRPADEQAFVVTEKNGSWGTAIEVPGLAALNSGAYAGIDSVSCASAGNCAVTGYYDNGAPEAFVVSETNGSWGTAIEVPGPPAFGIATFASVSCASAANCAAVGYSGSPIDSASAEPLAVSEKNGAWGKAIPVPGTTASAINEAVSVSCGSPGTCVAGGRDATEFNGPYQAFVAQEKNGSWGTATGIPGLAALNAGGNAEVFSVSCGSARHCSAGGFYSTSSGASRAFVASENNGSWGKAIEVPGLARLSAGQGGAVIAVSCTWAGYCAAGGGYTNQSGTEEAFVVNRT